MTDVSGSPSRYVERGGMQCHLQPFDCQNVIMYGFYLQGERTNLQSTVDRYLNGPAGGAVDYRVLSDMVMVTFARFAEGRSTLEPDRSMGYIPETSCTLWILTASVKQKAGVYFAERLAYFVPYIIVDNGYSMTAGREVYGFPKELGSFQMPCTPGEIDKLSVSSLVLPDFSISTQAEVRVLIEVSKTGGGFLKTAWHDAEDAFKSIFELLAPNQGRIVLPGLGLVADVWKDITHHRVPAVFLKQFRDAADGRNACYQAIIETGVEVTNFREGGLLDGTYEFEVSNFASHPLHQDLGLSSSSQPAHLPFYMKYDLVAGNGEEVWKAGSA